MREKWKERVHGHLDQPVVVLLEHFKCSYEWEKRGWVGGGSVCV